MSGAAAGQALIAARGVHRAPPGLRPGADLAVEAFWVLPPYVGALPAVTARKDLNSSEKVGWQCLAK